MKLTAASLSFMLLAGMFSCVTKDRSETYIPDDNVLSEMPVKKEKAILTPLPTNKRSSTPKTVKPELVDVYIHPSICLGTSAEWDIIPPPVEEDSIEIKEDDSKVLFICNMESEAEYPGGTKAWLRYLHSNVKVPKDIIDSEIDTNVVVQFVVDEEGCVREAKVIKGSTALGAEVVRVIDQSSKWIPAKRLSTGRCIRSFKMQPFKVCFEAEE